MAGGHDRPGAGGMAQQLQGRMPEGATVKGEASG